MSRSPFRVSSWSALVLLAASSLALGQTGLVVDLVPGTSGSSPNDLVVVGDQLYYRANVPTLGQELVKSDGTAAGTAAVLDIRPGGAGSNAQLGVAVGNRIFFSANDGTSGDELWVSDGTPGGTQLVLDIRPGGTGSNPAGLVAVGNRCFFRADDGSSGLEVWVSDGTPAGTRIVRDINPGTATSNPAQLVSFLGECYFRADDGAGQGLELWRSDGTPAGTTMLVDLNPGSPSSAPAEFLALGNTLYFRAAQPATNVELFKTDGTAAGTVLVKDIRPTLASFPEQLTDAQGGGRFYFVANDGTLGKELWVSDGTSAGTVQVADIRPGFGGSNPTQLTVVGSQVFFQADDGTSGDELWVFDASANTTGLTRDINSGAANSSPGFLAEVGGLVYFSANDGSNGIELWRSDGTSAGTVMVSDLVPGGGSSTPRHLRGVAGVLLFQATTPSTGTELFRLDRQIDLEVYLSAASSTPPETKFVELTMSAFNKGPSTATQVKLELSLPTGLTLVSATPSSGTFTSGLWEVPAVASGRSESVVVRAQLVSGTAPLNVSAGNLSLAESDTNAGNDSANLVLTPQTYDQALSLSVDDTTPLSGGNVVYTCTVENQSSISASLEVSSQLPIQFTLAGSVASIGSYDAIARVWSLTLPAGGSATLDLRGTVSGDPGDVLSSTATITSSAGAAHLDGLGTNDSASASSTLRGPSASGGGAPLPRYRVVGKTSGTGCSLGPTRSAPSFFAFLLFGCLLLVRAETWRASPDRSAAQGASLASDPDLSSQ